MAARRTAGKADKPNEWEIEFAELMFRGHTSGEIAKHFAGKSDRISPASCCEIMRGDKKAAHPAVKKHVEVLRRALLDSHEQCVLQAKCEALATLRAQLDATKRVRLGDGVESVPDNDNRIRAAAEIRKELDGINLTGVVTAALVTSEVAARMMDERDRLHGHVFNARTAAQRSNGDGQPADDGGSTRRVVQVSP